MKTTGILTKKTFKELQPENEKLGLFSKQVDSMRDDFEDMKRTREEARKQLEAKFQDVHRKIQNTKEFIQAEGKRINDTLLAFQSKFEKELADQKNHFQNQHDNFTQEVEARFGTVDEKLEDLDKKIDQEREDRLKQSEETLRDIRKQLASLFDICEEEKQARLIKEKEIFQKIDDESFNLKEMLEKERHERVVKTKELRDETEQELKAQKKFNEDFHTKTIDEFHHVVDNLQSEMDNRFDHQDKIIDNLSNIVKTFQDTLKVIGKDA
ncbi:hypothetical protein PPERSA_03880 [Pseudocohnilembus persalinus]|uniref:SF-assemblin n=1 Tax=Pseudocohnilembus persalinus TaxID=266149 RepID=A0A0V0Q946_PSEPJ|nr:hypothetical protein PPERSA_03880 [Pseudocohnilembus persalinus]|eukprot:KRW98745.1 hypothetical protein PPERSA_03880 [Pseudocohnilembus persalinus]